mmetsp:Transcript_1421/g.2616  ORF Transcript_1421/g.2616 Transcript_1421/m.2616 type:complete len:577 (+) Transcript_1421:435-2165(+)
MFEDGTSRTTLAAMTRGLSSIQDLELGDVSDPSKCTADFKEAVAKFRETVADVSTKFMQRVGEVFDTTNVPLLEDFNQTKRYTNFEEIAAGANHLEHFHSYHLQQTKEEEAALSIDMHADQGLFIAFTPALLVEDKEAGEKSEVVEGASAGTFYVEMKDGVAKATEFGNDNDVLVFLLGDGVEQYFNKKFQGTPLRAAPHAMIMPEHTPTQSRAWYGRMFLPPDDAIHEEHGISFGKVREVMIQQVASGGGVGTGMGCSRKLQETEQLECGENQMFCWMRCMDYTEEANPEVCDEQNLNLQCASQRDQIYRDGIDSHGDYNPTCTNSTEFITPDPPIPPRPESCEDADFSAFVSESDYSFKHTLNPKTHLLWSVVDDKLHVRMVYNGIVGYLALGVEAEHEGPEPGVRIAHPGMNGAPVVMGVNDPDPDVFGAPYVGTGVDEYQISWYYSAFRHFYDKPFRPTSLTQASMNISSCFSGMAFATDAIFGVPLNLTAGANNTMIWSIHDASYLKGYHGYMNKGRLNVDFASGEVYVPVSPVAAVEKNETTPPPVGSSATSAGVSLAFLVAVALVAIPI